MAETLSYMAFPREQWTQIRTHDPLERIMREIRRRTRVVGVFQLQRQNVRPVKLEIETELMLFGVTV